MIFIRTSSFRSELVKLKWWWRNMLVILHPVHNDEVDITRSSHENERNLCDLCWWWSNLIMFLFFLLFSSHSFLAFDWLILILISQIRYTSKSRIKSIEINYSTNCSSRYYHRRKSSLEQRVLCWNDDRVVVVSYLKLMVISVYIAIDCSYMFSLSLHIFDTLPFPSFVFPHPAN